MFVKFLLEYKKKKKKVLLRNGVDQSSCFATRTVYRGLWTVYRGGGDGGFQDADGGLHGALTLFAELR